MNHHINLQDPLPICNIIIIPSCNTITELTHTILTRFSIGTGGRIWLWVYNSSCETYTQKSMWLSWYVRQILVEGRPPNCQIK